MMWESLETGLVHCYLCAHDCRIAEGRFGFCGMRQNLAGKLYTYAFGAVIAKHVDPIEKKPFYHFLPGTYAYSIAVMGCNFRCDFCQNWSISQLSRRDNGEGEEEFLEPEWFVKKAIQDNCYSIAYTYTEPTIFFEYAYEIARLAKEHGLYNSFVTNGFMTQKAIEEISPYLDAANVDLKFFSDESYQKICKGRLRPVLDSISNFKKAGIWVEVTTLIIPEINDSDKELKAIAEFLAGVGKEIPWHISRFHPDYKRMDSILTPLDTMERAKEIGVQAGLKYVYLGNVPMRTDTVCSGCGSVLVKRTDFGAGVNKIFFSDNRCVKCGNFVEGVWNV